MTEAGWTSKKPTAAGFYWFKYDFTYIVEIVDVDGKLEVWFHGNEMQSPITYLDGEWLGPISPDDRQQGRVEGAQEYRDAVIQELHLDDAARQEFTRTDVVLALAHADEQLAQQAQGGVLNG